MRTHITRNFMVYTSHLAMLGWVCRSEGEHKRCI